MSLYKQIVVAVDFSPSSVQAIMRARALAQAESSHLTLIHTVEAPTYPVLEDIAVTGMPGIWDDEITTGWVKRSDEKLSELATRYKADSFRTLIGYPASEILAFAEQSSADLIVMGYHGTSGWRRLIGSTTNAVIHDSKCDVLAVKTDS
ncbi:MULTISPECIES: universal stress protein [Thiomicrorhabdus]|uniref:Universal stress protein n=1 Tax=Thiomicrorhabdus heinhorstiae TaxID=2748010 RepID=A0ABS0BSI3_9GAMM|nr:MULTISPECIES: universal stress protein [Thiomicrorhabdus]MBF6056831.1 universal stress protein [Thiomicrorhabdus heinhorstiae]